MFKNETIRILYKFFGCVLAKLKSRYRSPKNLPPKHNKGSIAWISSKNIKLMRLGVANRTLSSNRIWNPNSIVDFSGIRNPTRKLSRGLWFWCKIDLFQSKFDLFLLKDWYKDRKGRLKDRKSRLKDKKSWLKDQKGQFLSKKLIKFNHFRLKWNYFWLKSI